MENWRNLSNIGVIKKQYQPTYQAVSKVTGQAETKSNEDDDCNEQKVEQIISKDEFHENIKNLI